MHISQAASAGDKTEATVASGTLRQETCGCRSALNYLFANGFDAFLGQVRISSEPNTSCEMRRNSRWSSTDLSTLLQQLQKITSTIADIQLQRNRATERISNPKIA